MPGPYPVRLTQVLAALESSPGQDAVARTVTLEGTVNGANVNFDVPGSHQSNNQLVTNALTTLRDGVADPAATVQEGMGASGRDRVMFSTPPTLSATAQVLQGLPLNVGAFSWRTEVNETPRVAYTQGLDQAAPLPGLVRAGARFDLPVMADVAAGRPPALSVVLKAAGFAEAENSGVFTYTLASAMPPSATFYAWLGATVRRLTGAVADLNFVFEAGEPGVAQVTLSGNHLTPADADYPTGLSLPAADEPVTQEVSLTVGFDALLATVNHAGGYGVVDTVLTLASTAGLAAEDLLMPVGGQEVLRVASVDSATQITVARGARGSDAAALADGATLRRLHRVVCPRFTLGLNNTLADRLSVNSPWGLHSRHLTGRAPTGVIEVEQEPEATRAYWQDFETGATVPLGFELGAATGQRVAFVMPAARLVRPEDTGEDHWRYTLHFALAPVAGQPALKIRFY